MTAGLTPENIVEDLKHLPSAPRVLPRLKRLLVDGNSSMEEIVALIRIDPGIAARVLQVGNSAYFSKGLRCMSVDEAVIRVGYDEIYNLVSHAVASQVLERPLAVYGLESEDLWRQSVACAIGAELLAVHCGEDVSVAYTIGLLHGIGMVAIDEWALRNGPTLMFTWQKFPKEYANSERALIGFTQAEVGSTLLRMWGFPADMSEPFRWQYAPGSAGGHAKMTSVMIAAKWLRTAVCSQGDAPLPTFPDDAVLKRLHLTTRQLVNYADGVRTQLGVLDDQLAAA